MGLRPDLNVTECHSLSCLITSFLSLAGRVTMEFACGFVYVPPSLSQKERRYPNITKRSGMISVDTAMHYKENLSYGSHTNF